MEVTGRAPTVEQCEVDEADTSLAESGPVDRIVSLATRKTPPRLRDFIPDAIELPALTDSTCLITAIKQEAQACRPASMSVTAAYARRGITRPQVNNRLEICGNVSKGMCLSAVKDSLLACRLAKTRPPGEAAKNIGGELQKLGFINYSTLLQNDPGRAPAGAIVVYRGGDYGHVEVKVSAKPDRYCSDFCSYNRSQRQVVGIYLRPSTTVRLRLEEGEEEGSGQITRQDQNQLLSGKMVNISAHIQENL